MDWTLHGVGLDDFADLVSEQIDRVRGVMPQQVIGPAARFAFGVMFFRRKK